MITSHDLPAKGERVHFTSDGGFSGHITLSDHGQFCADIGGVHAYYHADRLLTVLRGNGARLSARLPLDRYEARRFTLKRGRRPQFTLLGL